MFSLQTQANRKSLSHSAPAVKVASIAFLPASTMTKSSNINPTSLAIMIKLNTITAYLPIHSCDNTPITIHYVGKNPLPGIRATDIQSISYGRPPEKIRGR
eukprot:TRINITY_DN2031_c0_g1_i1.p1 TRINITY_DN2031_c0_g1~~TRINITY_DN2031_c0_g1_i1.p1  ORF type:complete len:101 (-),score=4.71 TRINITY_DN2031_c0_g1_i1:314-616(-)